MTSAVFAADPVCGTSQFLRSRGAGKNRLLAEASGSLTNLPASSGSPAIVDVLMLYTRAALEGAGSEKAIGGLIDQEIGRANEIFKNSEIHVRLNLVYRGQTSYQESGSILADVAYLQSVNDNELADAHQLRTTYKADVVLLIVETDNNGYGGVAWSLGLIQA